MVHSRPIRTINYLNDAVAFVAVDARANLSGSMSGGHYFFRNI